MLSPLTLARPVTAARPRGRLLVLALAAGLAALSATPALADGGQPRVSTARDGQQLYESNCAACHGAGGAGTSVAPDLGGVVERIGREAVAAAIRDGRDATPPMPAFGSQLSDGQVEALVGHLATLDAAATEAPAPEAGGDAAGDAADGQGSSGGSLALLLGLAVLALLVAGGVWLVRGSGSGPSADDAAPPGRG